MFCQTKHADEIDEILKERNLDMNYLYSLFLLY